MTKDPGRARGRGRSFAEGEKASPPHQGRVALKNRGIARARKGGGDRPAENPAEVREYHSPIKLERGGTFQKGEKKAL